MNIIKFIGNYEFIHYAEKLLLKESPSESKILELPSRIVWNEIYSIPAFTYSDKFMLCRGLESIIRYIKKYEGKKYNLITDRFIFSNDDIKYLKSQNAQFFTLRISNPEKFELKEISIEQYKDLIIEDIEVGEIRKPYEEFAE